MYARIAGLADAPDSAAPLGDLDGYTPERLGAIDTLLARIDTRRQLLQSLPGNVWRGCAITTGSFELRGQIRTRLRALLAALSETQAAAAGFAKSLELPAPNDLAGARALHGLAALLHEPYLLPAEWLAAGPDPTRRGIIVAARQDYAALADAEARLAQRHRETLLESRSGWHVSALHPALRRLDARAAAAVPSRPCGHARQPPAWRCARTRPPRWPISSWPQLCAPPASASKRSSKA